MRILMLKITAQLCLKFIIQNKSVYCIFLIEIIGANLTEFLSIKFKVGEGWNNILLTIFLLYDESEGYFFPYYYGKSHFYFVFSFWHFIVNDY